MWDGFKLRQRENLSLYYLYYSLIYSLVCFDIDNLYGNDMYFKIILLLLNPDDTKYAIVLAENDSHIPVIAYYFYLSLQQQNIVKK